MSQQHIFADPTELEARYGFSYEALEQFEAVFRYLDEEADPSLVDEIKTSDEGLEQLVNFATELRVFDGVNLDA
tara:strand:- start:869 stop:1090 length:222 start_codon:yes stop_codon:yes gene_type:complete